ncbi:MAG: aminotransferase class V-fold PLP-dependent enzyme [Acidobacteriota bacterium]|nr:aminotransferase class V-fold PLP-dependent enzyme [Acidobacteriota bacterium]
MFKGLREHRGDSEDVVMMDGEVDWRRIREDFPVTQTLAYLNSAGAGPVPRRVASAATDYYQDLMERGDARWSEWIAQRERGRTRLAEMINAEPDEIAFTTNTSSGMNLIIDALERSGEVISCDLEFPVSTITWMHRSIKVHLLKAVDGEVRAEEVASAMTEKTGVICMSHVQYSNGFRLNPAEVGEIKGRHAFVLNASQSAGVLPIDVKRMRVDALCATGHKWMLGGYGSGFVYLSRELLQRTRPRAISWLSVEDPFAMKNDEFRLRTEAGARAESGCPPFASIFALGEAARYHLSIGAENVERRALELNRHLTARLIERGWNILSPLKNEDARSAETLVVVEHPKQTVSHLSSRGVAVTIKPEGFRAATHFFNNEDDIARLIAALDETRASG